MESAWPVDEWQVQPGSFTNGVINSYTFTITTRVNLIDGDYVIFTFPPQVQLPEDLIVRPVPRFIDNNLVEDVIIIERESGSTVKITFITVVGNASDSYRWVIDGVYNPPSTQQSDPFTGLTVYNLNGY